MKSFSPQEVMVRVQVNPNYPAPNIRSILRDKVAAACKEGILPSTSLFYQEYSGVSVAPSDLSSELLYGPPFVHASLLQHM